MRGTGGRLCKAKKEALVVSELGVASCEISLGRIGERVIGKLLKERMRLKKALGKETRWVGD